VSFSYRIRQCFCLIPRFDLCHVPSSSTNNFAHAQTLFRMSSLSGRMNIARVNIGFFTGFKKMKQRRISFVLSYLRLILWKISTAISIKHRILATFNKKKINSDSLYAFKLIFEKFNRAIIHLIPEYEQLIFRSWLGWKRKKNPRNHKIAILCLFSVYSIYSVFYKIWKIVLSLFILNKLCWIVNPLLFSD
jgi:hypothetical protein